MMRVTGIAHVREYCQCEHCIGHSSEECWDYIIDDSGDTTPLEMARRMAEKSTGRIKRPRQVDIDCSGITVEQYDPRDDGETIIVPHSNLWADFIWPGWVPVKVRKDIEDFWCEWSHRGPMKWSEFRCGYPGKSVPVFGSYYTSKIPDGSYIAGRFVFAWNNMGRLVLPDGSYRVISF